MKRGGGPIYLFFSVNKGQHFNAVASLQSDLKQSHSLSSDIWLQKQTYTGYFEVKFIWVKDIPNFWFKEMQNEYIQNSVLRSRDTQKISP